MSKLTLSKVLLPRNFKYLGISNISLAIEISILAQVIIELHTLWLVENCIIFRNNHLARGNYSRALDLEMAVLGFGIVTQEAINAMEENTILKRKMTLLYTLLLLWGKTTALHDRLELTLPGHHRKNEKKLKQHELRANSLFLKHVAILCCNSDFRI